MHHSKALTVPEDFCNKFYRLLMEVIHLFWTGWDEVSCWPVFPATFPLSCSNCALAGLLSFRWDQFLPCSRLSCPSPPSAPDSATRTSTLRVFSKRVCEVKCKSNSFSYLPLEVSMWMMSLSCKHSHELSLLKASPPSETSGLWHFCWDQGAGKIRFLSR